MRPHLTHNERRLSTTLVAVVVGLSAVACGPSAQTRRACEMFVEAGGVNEQTLARRQKGWAELAEKVIQANPDMTQEQLEESAFQAGMAQKEVAKNKAAKVLVSARLTMSLAEVDRALERCPIQAWRIVL